MPDGAEKRLNEEFFKALGFSGSVSNLVRASYLLMRPSIITHTELPFDFRWFSGSRFEVIGLSTRQA